MSIVKLSMDKITPESREMVNKQYERINRMKKDSIYLDECGVELRVEYTYDPPDKETNYKGSVEINSIEVGGVNIFRLLDDNTVDYIQYLEGHIQEQIENGL